MTLSDRQNAIVELIRQEGYRHRGVGRAFRGDAADDTP